MKTGNIEIDEKEEKIKTDDKEEETKKQENDDLENVVRTENPEIDD